MVFGALLGALLHVSKFAMSALPNIEPITLLILLYALTFGMRVTLPAVGVFIGMEGLLFGFGLWWVSYLYVWPLWLAYVWLLRKNTGLLFWAASSGVFGLLFGFFFAIPYLLAGGPAAFFSYWVGGIPFDLIHCVGNVVLVFALYLPLKRAFDAIKRRLAKSSRI